ncbi:cob(I)yrinic acid a,c-diamide adenosyltransferase [Clostridium sp.]|uniref:cob(I)yrinic acid a,c-diamide adenosyltransferase n=1 Tax=Clostridium sp. TaxID=1506 RepID=UPI003F39A37F
MDLGLIHIYCGNGKGKTTAAMGLGMRAAGREKKVLLTQFLKSNKTGELNSIEKLSEFFHVAKGAPANKFVWNMTEEEKEIVKKEHIERFKIITKRAVDENYDLLILDEIIATINLDFVPLDLALEFLRNKPKTLEVVMTGRDPKEELVEIADYVSEINAIKHPFEKGIPSRVGIEI